MSYEEQFESVNPDLTTTLELLRSTTVVPLNLGETSERKIDEKTMRLRLKQLRELPIVRTRTLSEDPVSQERELSELATAINDAQPSTKEEESMRQMLFFMYRRNPRQMFSYLRKSGLAYLILWTDSNSIAQLLSIETRIFVGWDSENKRYICKKHTRYDENIQRRHRQPRRVIDFDRTYSNYATLE
jgi:hypothetical protein